MTGTTRSDLVIGDELIMRYNTKTAACNMLQLTFLFRIDFYLSGTYEEPLMAHSIQAAAGENRTLSHSGKYKTKEEQHGRSKKL